VEAQQLQVRFHCAHTCSYCNTLTHPYNGLHFQKCTRHWEATD